MQKMTNALFSGNMKMADVLMSNGRLLYILPYFGIGVGFGEKTIEEVCAEYEVSLPLFLMICNHYTCHNYVPNNAELKQVPVENVMWYLQSAHVYYLEMRMPKMIDAVVSLANMHGQAESKDVLMDFCEKYREAVIAHIKYEEEEVFTYIRKRLLGEKLDYKVEYFEDSQSLNMSVALRDLRNIIIKFTPRNCPVAKCAVVIYQLCLLEYDLERHSSMENTILLPLIERLTDDRNGNDSVDLSERERQTLVALARGLSNKEIAELLSISIHTVVSHRKNIVRKTGIKTAQGLTLYAYIHNMVSFEDMQ